MTAVSRTIRETLPPVDCAPWCEDGDGHPTATHPEDQWCGSSEKRTTLSRSSMVEVADGDWRLDYMAAYLVRGAFEARPTIHLGQGESRGANLSLDEARQLGEALIELARVGEAAA